MEVAILGSVKQNTKADSQSFKRLLTLLVRIFCINLKIFLNKSMYHHLSYIFIKSNRPFCLNEKSNK